MIATDPTELSVECVSAIVKNMHLFYSSFNLWRRAPKHHSQYVLNQFIKEYGENECTWLTGHKSKWPMANDSWKWTAHLLSQEQSCRRLCSHCAWLTVPSSPIG